MSHYPIIQAVNYQNVNLCPLQPLCERKYSSLNKRKRTGYFYRSEVVLIIGALLCFCSESDKGSSQGVEVIELSDTANAPHCQAHSKMNVDWKVLLYSFPMPASMILDHLIGLPLHQSFSCGLGAAGQQTQLIFGSLDTLVLWEHQLFHVFPFIESLSRQPVVVAVNLVKSV